MASSIDSEVRNMSGFSIGQIECTLSGNWWVFFIRGVLFVLLGALALAMPISAVIALTLLFGAFSFVDGVLALWSGVRRMRKNKRWGWLIASGLIGIVTGAIVLIAPYVASLALALFLWGMIAFWSIMRGGMEIPDHRPSGQRCPRRWLGVRNLRTDFWWVDAFARVPSAAHRKGRRCSGDMKATGGMTKALAVAGRPPMSAPS